MLPPQKPVGIGFSRKCWYDFKRKSVIHCGSFLTREISRTTSSLSPFSVRYEYTALSLSLNPNL